MRLCGMCHTNPIVKKDMCQDCRDKIRLAIERLMARLEH